MSNRGRHKKEKYTIRITPGMYLPCYKYTLQGRKYLKNINVYKLYRIYINKNNEVWRIEEDIKNHLNI